MRITSFEFSFIKSFKSLHFSLDRTSVLVGQNDHGKSSILKAIDIVLNRIEDAMIEEGALHPDLAERLLPIFSVNAKARRITIAYDDQGKKKKLYITIRSNLSFIVHEKIARNAKTTTAAVTAFRRLREHNEFLLIPALRDASSPQFQEMFSRILKMRGLDTIIPQKAGGTPKEYRQLKSIRDDIAGSIKPYIDDKLLPEIEKYFGFQAEHKLALKFDTEVQDVGEWILSNLKLGFQLGDNETSTIALSEAGTGVQSGVLLALHRLEQQAADKPDVQYILAVEEPEAFLHPQKQRELYQDILAAQSKNLRIIVTTHSPYLVADTKFSRIGLVRRNELDSALHVPEISDKKEEEMFDAYSSDVNSILFFADKVILVEGESDARVLRVMLQKKYGPKAHRISVISASGNKNFSPFLRMLRAWSAAKIPHLTVTDFDSLTKETERAILAGAKAAGFGLKAEQAFHSKVDFAVDKGEEEFSQVAAGATSYFAEADLNVFVFTSDLEFALVTPSNFDVATKVLTQCATNGVDYTKGYDLGAIRRNLGSKGVPLNPADKPPFKKPFVHRKIAETINLSAAHSDWGRLFSLVDAM